MTMLVLKGGRITFTTKLRERLTLGKTRFAKVAQSVEHHSSKVGVAESFSVFRSNMPIVPEEGDGTSGSTPPIRSKIVSCIFVT